MFGFLKDKLKKAISIFTKKVSEVSETQGVSDDAQKSSISDKPEEKKAPERKITGKEKPRIEEKKKAEPKKKKPEPKKEPREKFIEEAAKKEEQILEQEKEIIEEEKQLEEIIPKEEGTEIEKEVGEAVKEEQQKSLEEERIEKETENYTIQKEEEKGKKGFFGFFKKKKEEKEAEEPVKEEKIPEEPKKGFFGKIAETITTKKIDESKFDELFWDLELALLENNVAVEVIDKIKEDLKKNLVEKALPRNKIEEIIENTLKDSIKEILDVKPINILEKIKSKKPYVICFVGINGSGKTTSIAKLVYLLQQKKLSCVIAAADTFRAAAIDQLQIHADRLGVKLIKQDYGADPAAVAFDAIKHAQTKGIDVVLIDTAGRMHSNTNLIDEMKKIMRVAKPDLKVFVGESITGNDCIEQAKEFNEAVDIDGIILSKADVDEKGGAALSVSYITKKPILYIGTGQEYKDLKEFSTDVVLNNLGL